MEIIGHIYRIDPTAERVDAQGTPRKTRTFVLYVGNDRNPQYPDYIQFEMYGDRCANLDAWQPRMKVKVNFDIKGRKYEKKDGTGEGFFTTLSAWGVVSADIPQVALNQFAGYPQTPQPQQTVIPGATPTQAGYPPMPPAAPQQPSAPSPDLPF